jgi:nitrogen fixation protein FixH
MSISVKNSIARNNGTVMSKKLARRAARKVKKDKDIAIRKRPATFNFREERNLTSVIHDENHVSVEVKNNAWFIWLNAVYNWSRATWKEFRIALSFRMR